jgi:hypothetical protein
MEPVGVTDRAAQSKRALELLQRINDGERSFQPAGLSATEIEAFQDLARDLDWLARQGYLQFFKPLRESQSGARRFVALQVGDLSYEGVLYLEHLKAASSGLSSTVVQSSHSKDLFSLVGLDL